MSVCDTFPARGAIFNAVRFGSKGRAAYRTTLSILGLKKLGIQELIKRKYGKPEPLAKQRIGNKLRADARFPVVK